MCNLHIMKFNLVLQVPFIFSFITKGDRLLILSVEACSGAIRVVLLTKQGTLILLPLCLCLCIMPTLLQGTDLPI